MINYTVKLILWKSGVNEKEEMPIYIQITIQRKTSYIATGHTTTVKNWDPKNQLVKHSHPDHKTINPDLTHRKGQVLKKIVELQVQGKEFSAKSIKTSFAGKDPTNIFNFIDKYCQEVKNKKSDDTIENYQKHRRKLKDFWGSENLHFEEITVDFLAKYEQHLRSTEDDKKGAGSNYVHAIWKTLKTWFNAAKKKKLIDVYPFDEYENPVYTDPEKDYLSLDELKELEVFADTTTNPVLKETATYFLFGCYSGLRISDWRKFDINKHVNKNRVQLRAKKNGEPVTVPLSGPLARNIERMRLVPLQIEEPTINEKIKVIAEKIQIEKYLTSHCARKTFAVTMCADNGISLEVCATLMGITVDVCFKNYYRITDYKINKEVITAWSGL